MNQDITDNRQVQAFATYLQESEKSAATVEKYMHDVRVFCSFVGNRAIDKQLLLEYKAYLGERYAVASANSMLAALNAYLRFCGMSELCVKLVLRHLGVNVLLLRRYLNIEHGKSKAVVLSECASLCLLLELCVGVADVLLCAILTENTELTGHIVELANQLNANLHDLTVCAIRGAGAVLTALAAGFLQSSNSGGSCNSRTNVACARLGIARGFAQLLHGSVIYVDVVGIKRVMLNDAE